MELLVHREKNTEKSCIGTLDVDRKKECLTLEPPVRVLGPMGEGKIFGKTAIPAGRYKVIIDFSQRFQRFMLHVLNVPFFTGIRIHSGSSDINTEGCLLVGLERENDDLMHGGLIELPKLQKEVQLAFNRGEQCWITYKNEFTEPLL